MQSSLAIVLSLTLGFSPHPCVSIFGTGDISFARSFSWKLASEASVLTSLLSIRFTSSYFTVRIFLHCYYPACSSSSIRWILLAFSVTPSLIHQYRNLHLLSIDYAFRPRLRSRLTQSGRTFLWNPWVFGAWDSHPRFATHTGILSSNCSTFPFDNASPLLERSPTNYLRKSIASVLYLAPVYFRRRVIRLVSCYALFKGWLLLSQPPSCLYISTSFST